MTPKHLIILIIILMLFVIFAAFVLGFNAGLNYVNDIVSHNPQLLRCLSANLTVI